MAPEENLGEEGWDVDGLTEQNECRELEYELMKAQADKEVLQSRVDALEANQRQLEAGHAELLSTRNRTPRASLYNTPRDRTPRGSLCSKRYPTPTLKLQYPHFVSPVQIRISKQFKRRLAEP